MASENDTSALAFFLLGSIVGAAAALLLAPKTGRETRSLLRDSGLQFKKLAQEGLDASKESMDDFVRRGKELMDETSHRLVAAFEAGKDAMKEELLREKEGGEGSPKPETY